MTHARAGIHNILICIFAGLCLLLVWFITGDYPVVLDAVLAVCMVVVAFGIVAGVLTANETKYDP